MPKEKKLIPTERINGKLGKRYSINRKDKKQTGLLIKKNYRAIKSHLGIYVDQMKEENLYISIEIRSRVVITGVYLVLIR